MRKFCFLLLLFACLALSIAESADAGFQLSREAELRVAMLRSPMPEVQPLYFPQETEEAPGMKNSRLGALFSAVVPGAGEMYGGSWIKGAVFLTAEIALWVGFSGFSSEGQDWEDQFHAYADLRWSEPEYWVGIAGEAGISGVTTANYTQYLDQLREEERARHSHSLHLNKDQQYYEMIGKYDQFRYGWDDWQSGDAPLTENREWYETMRHNGNKEFKKASTCAMLALANHLISALDAAWTISQHNKQIQTSVFMQMKPIRNEPVPFYGLNVQW